MSSNTKTNTSAAHVPKAATQPELVALANPAEEPASPAASTFLLPYLKLTLDDRHCS